MEVKLTSIFLSTLLLVFTTLLVKVLNWVWFRPKKLEKLLREQGLHGNSNRFIVGDMKDMIRASKDERTRVIQLYDNLLRHILPFYHSTISKYGDVISRTVFGISSEAGRKGYMLPTGTSEACFGCPAVLFHPWMEICTNKSQHENEAISKEIGCLLRGIVDNSEKAMGTGEDISEDLFAGVKFQRNS